MALQNSLAERMDNLNVAISNAMKRNKVTPKDIEAHKIMHSNTFYVKMQNPDRFKFSEFWRLDDLLHFNDYERELILGEKRN